MRFMESAQSMVLSLLSCTQLLAATIMWDWGYDLLPYFLISSTWIVWLGWGIACALMRSARHKVRYFASKRLRRAVEIADMSILLAFLSSLIWVGFIPAEYGEWLSAVILSMGYASSLVLFIFAETRSDRVRGGQLSEW